MTPLESLTAFPDNLKKNPEQGYLGKFTWPETNFFEFWAFCCRPCLNEPVSPVIFFGFVDVQT